MATFCFGGKLPSMLSMLSTATLKSVHEDMFSKLAPVFTLLQGSSKQCKRQAAEAILTLKLSEKHITTDWIIGPA